MLKNNPNAAAGAPEQKLNDLTNMFNQKIKRYEKDLEIAKKNLQKQMLNNKAITIESEML